MQNNLTKKSLFAHYLVLIFFQIPSSLSLLAQNIDRIDPPWWYSGMQWSQVDLVLYGQDIAKAAHSFEISDPARLLRVIPTEQNNLLIVRVDLSQCSGKIELHWKQGKKDCRREYEVKENPDQGFFPGYVNEQDIMYLVMPDRFANGDPSNDVIKGMNQSEVNREEPLARHGGDLKGIQSKLKYLTQLGMSALWLNPVQTNDQPHESYHGYAITDHYAIDPRLGSLNDYVSLVKEANKLGIKMVMDVVYNHWGNEHVLYKNLPFRSWVHTHDSFYQTNYRASTMMDPYAALADKERMLKGWFDRHMPDMNTEDSLYSRYMIQNTLWWVATAGLSGLRIDTYAYPGMNFALKLQQALKLDFPELFVVGEIWDHSIGIQAWFTQNNLAKHLSQDLPSVTDFQLHFALQRAMNEPFGWTEGMNRIYYVLAQDFLYHNPNQFITFLDNHDVDRFAGVVQRDTGKIKSALSILLTTRGIPCIYYGTELGWSEQGNHGLLRKDVPGGWPGDRISLFDQTGLSTYERAIWEHLRTLAHLRRSHKAFSEGKLIQYVPEKGIYCYFRLHEEGSFMIVVNQNPEPALLPLNRFHNELQNKTLHNALNGERIPDAPSILVNGNSALILTIN